MRVRCFKTHSEPFGADELGSGSSLSKMSHGDIPAELSSSSGTVELAKDGGIVVSWNSRFATLIVRASRYDSGGADSELMLDEITETTRDTRAKAFNATLIMRGIWWSKDRRESSEHCMRVPSGCFALGCDGAS